MSAAEFQLLKICNLLEICRYLRDCKTNFPGEANTVMWNNYISLWEMRIKIICFCELGPGVLRRERWGWVRPEVTEQESTRGGGTSLPVYLCSGCISVCVCVSMHGSLDVCACVCGWAVMYMQEYFNLCVPAAESTPHTHTHTQLKTQTVWWITELSVTWA